MTPMYDIGTFEQYIYLPKLYKCFSDSRLLFCTLCEEYATGVKVLGVEVVQGAEIPLVEVPGVEVRGMNVPDVDVRGMILPGVDIPVALQKM